MVKKSQQALVFLFVFVIAVVGCSGGQSLNVIADFQGEWISTEGKYPILSLDAGGKGQLEVIVISSTNDGVKKIVQHKTDVEVEQKDGKSFIDYSIGDSTGARQHYRIELLLNESQTLKMKVVDSSDKREFTLRRK